MSAQVSTCVAVMGLTYLLVNWYLDVEAQFQRQVHRHVRHVVAGVPHLTVELRAHLIARLSTCDPHRQPMSVVVPDAATLIGDHWDEVAWSRRPLDGTVTVVHRRPPPPPTPLPVVSEPAAAKEPAHVA